MPKKFKKGKQDIEINTDTFKVFVRPRKMVTMSCLQSLVEHLRKSKIIVISNDIDIIVVNKDGTTIKY